MDASCVYGCLGRVLIFRTHGGFCGFMPVKLFTGKMNLELKKRIMKCLAWSVALYAAETWTLTQTDRRLEAFEM